jgi:hypothetical protein
VTHVLMTAPTAATRIAVLCGAAPSTPRSPRAVGQCPKPPHDIGSPDSAVLHAKLY